MTTQLFDRDLAILEEMVRGLSRYLASDATFWTVDTPNMPKLSIGGMLMRVRRLSELRQKLSAEQQARLDAAIQLKREALREQVVRFERRAHQELHARLSEWIGHLKGFRINQPIEYAARVDARVLILELASALSQPPYSLDSGVLDEINALDRHLKTRFNAGQFIWDPEWEAAYPRATFWWLYGSVTEPHNPPLSSQE